MAVSTCAKCGNHVFEVQLNESMHSGYKIYFVQCATCGTVVSTADFFSISSMIIQQNEAIRRIAAKVGVHVDLQQ